MKLGISSKYFYYTRTGAASFLMCPRIIFKEPLRLKELKEAADEAIALYPELAMRTVIKDGKLEAEANDLGVAFFPEGDGKHQIGGDEALGHLFFIRYGERQISLVCYHGWSDYKGINTYMRTLLYLYAKKTGFALSQEDEAALAGEIRMSAEDYMGMDEEDMYDPYGKYARANTPAYSYDYPEASGIDAPTYEPSDPYVHRYLVETSTSAFLKKTKENGVSFVPLLVNCLSGGIYRTFGKKDLPVVAMVPSDARKFFGSKTLVNFSDGMLFPYYGEYEDMTLGERCGVLKDYLVKQNQKDNFENILALKTKDVENFEKRDILTPAAPAGAPAVRRITYALSYVGRADFGYGLDGMVEDFYFEPYVQSFAAICYTYRDSLRVYVMQRSDDERFPESLRKGFEDLGLSATLTDLGRECADQINLAGLKKI